MFTATRPQSVDLLCSEAAAGFFIACLPENIPSLATLPLLSVLLTVVTCRLLRAFKPMAAQGSFYACNRTLFRIGIELLLLEKPRMANIFVRSETAG